MTTALRIEERPVQNAYEKLRKGYMAKPYPSHAERVDWLERLERLLVARREDFVKAADADFAGRCRGETLIADVVVTLETVRASRKQVGRWMRSQEVSPSVYFLPSRAYIEYIPKGVVGIISPWNYPLNLALAPLSAALAAGNRAIVKPSELTPRVSALIGEAIRDNFTAEEVAVVEGGPEVAEEVTHLPLDHLFFTGSTAVGKKVAAAAAENLVPTTLELGGKSPALIHPDFPIEAAAERIALGKLFNGGQTCIAPDYVLLPAGREAAFTDAFRATVQRCYPDLARGSGYTSVVSQRHLERLRALVEDAKSKGARLEVVSPDGQPAADSRKFPPVLAFEVTDSMRLMQEEIFGGILPVKSYKTMDEALAYVNGHPRPLAFYYFDRNPGRAEELLTRTPSGGACINNTLLHFAQEELPFGGVGASGIGAYHGQAGFLTFSHARGVLAASRFFPAKKVQSPPYGKLLDRSLGFIMRGLKGLGG
jgi:acyl-CoA reductase-like NAD-dependent aldehyde dehydrogenase